MVQNVKFRDNSMCKSSFQRNLSADLKKINENPKIIAQADKTSNHYSVDADKYREDLSKAMNREYKKAPSDIVE